MVPFNDQVRPIAPIDLCSVDLLSLLDTIQPRKYRAITQLGRHGIGSGYRASYTMIIEELDNWQLGRRLVREALKCLP